MQTPSLLITGHFTTLHDCTNPQSNYYYRYVFFNSRDEFLHPHWRWMLNITYFKPPKSKGAVLPHLQKFFWAMQRLCTAAHSWEAWGGGMISKGLHGWSHVHLEHCKAMFSYIWSSIPLFYIGLGDIVSISIAIVNVYVHADLKNDFKVAYINTIFFEASVPPRAICLRKRIRLQSYTHIPGSKFD